MKRVYIFTGISIAILLFFGYVAHCQQSDCKVLIPTLSGSYSGKCKKGLANGKGIAQGIDKYEGQFSRGLPQGNGIYTWSNGSTYNGEWLEGKRNGSGKMIYHLSDHDSIVSGFWKNDKYVGSELIAPYSINRNVGVVRYNIRKLNETVNNVSFKFLIGGRANSDIEGLSIISSSGDQYNSGFTLGIQSFMIPMDVKITYRTWNSMHTSQSNVSFEFTINEPGRWEVTINN